MKKKIWIPIAAVILLAVLFVPIPTGHYKDGGTKEYTALTYKIVNWKRITGDSVYDKKTVVLSILGTYFNGMVLDHFIFDHNIKRRVCIITKKEEELRNFIIHDLHSGATIYESIGAYNMQKRNEIITIVDKSEYQKLMNHITKEDPQAFVTVYNVSSMRYQPKL